MAKDFDSVIKVGYNIFSDKMQRDVPLLGSEENQWNYARNAVLNTTVGDFGSISNEESNYLYTEINYYTKETYKHKNSNIKIIGAVHIQYDEWVIFSTDDLNSEIGLFKSEERSYIKIVNDKKLNFSKSNLITGVARINHKCGRRVYWDDGKNPSRVLDIDDVPYVKKKDANKSGLCDYYVDTKELDIEKLRLAPLMKPMKLSLQRGSISGQFVNGTYIVVGAYTIEDQKVSDYSIPSNPCVIFSHENVSGSLEITVNEIDEENFDTFELVVIQFANGHTVGKKIGKYSTRQKSILLSTMESSLADVNPTSILANLGVVDKSDAMFRNGSYIFRVGPTDKLDFNYQPLANQIKTKWVSVEYSADYYKKGGVEIGYLRDEVYSFFIRWVYNTGDRSNAYHIPGRRATTDDYTYIEGKRKWEIENTATVTYVDRTAPDGVGRIIAEGEMGYWESTERYDNTKPEVWDPSFNEIFQRSWTAGNPEDIEYYDLCGRNIRHHKFPANDQDKGINMVCNHYNPSTVIYTDKSTNKEISYTPGSLIRIMGVEFENILPPVDNEGNILINIVGYEILRGSRQGNKTILAKGIINNMREYNTINEDTKDENRRRNLYPNYPYNPLNAINDTERLSEKKDINPVAVDHFLSNEPTSSSNKKNDWNAFLGKDSPIGSKINEFGSNQKNILGNVRKDVFTFHSPDTMFNNPFLSAKEMVTYGTMTGNMKGFFQVPEGQPKQRFITDTSFMISVIIGLGYGLISMHGKKTHTHESPQIAYGGTKTDIGTSSGGTGLIGGTSTPASALIAANKVISSATLDLIQKTTSSIVGLTATAAGLDSDNLTEKAQKYIDDIISAISGNGGKDITSSEETEWKKIPAFLRTLQSLPVFLNYWSRGITQSMDDMYKWLSYKNHTLQQISHGFYDSFESNTKKNRTRTIVDSVYLNPTFQDLNTKWRINNLHRSRTVALEINEPVEFTDSNFKDNSQALVSEVFGKEKSVWYSKNDDDIDKEFTRGIASNYVALKQPYPNQYGQLDGIVQKPTSNTCYAAPKSFVFPESTNVIFGGDTFIGRYTEKNTMPFFYNWTNGEPDGTVFNYKMYKNVVHPRFWYDSNPFDISEFIVGLGSLFSGNSSSKEFDVYLINPKYTEEYINIYDSAGNYEQKNNPDYDRKAKCDCENKEQCYYNSSDVKPSVKNKFKKICKAEEDLKQAQVDYAYGQAWSCFLHTSIKKPALYKLMSEDKKDDFDSCEPCNADNDTLDEFLEEEYWNVQPSSWALKKRKKMNDQKHLTKYTCQDKGKVKRLLRRFEKRVEKAQRKYDRAIEKLEKKYEESLNNESGNFIERLKNKLVLPDDKFAFDRAAKQRSLSFAEKNAYMYLFVSGVRDFFVETEINLDCRDWGEKEDQRFYDYSSYTNLKEMFATKYIKSPNYMKYDICLTPEHLFNMVSWAKLQERDYSPYVSEKCYTYRPKRVIYSLPQEEEGVKDLWRVYLPLNYRDYTSKVTAIKQFGKFGAIMLFESESPVFFDGVDQVSTDSGIKLNFGDGTVLSKYAQHLDNSDFAIEYGSCQDRLSVVNTPYGMFYMSQNQGKIFSANSQTGLVDIAQSGMRWWFNKYLPYQLTKNTEVFKEVPFELTNNPVYGIGCQAVYDSESQKIFFCKKDYIIKDNGNTLKYKGNGKFLVVESGSTIKLGNPDYFEDASWTVSYDPTIKNGRFISWHDWHQDLALPCVDTFMTIKDNGIWKHNDNCHSYCNFYGVDYPYEVEFQVNSEGFNVETLSNVYYVMECYVYAENEQDRFHLLDEGFDEAIITNSEQCSGLLKLKLNPKNDPNKILEYPKIYNDNIEILFSKEEQVYKFNQFFDITDDRGEFNKDSKRTIWITSANGYERELNEKNLNYSKNETERKKFRHYKHNILLRKKVSGDKNMIMSIALVKKLNSFR